MTTVYLGFFDMLAAILKAVFVDILGPVLKETARMIFELLGGVIFDMLKEVLLDGLTIILKTVRALSMFFEVFAGISNVMVVTSNDVTKFNINMDLERMTFLEFLFQKTTISTAFGYLTILAAALAFIFAICANVKSISDSVLENEFRPISKVLINGLKSMMTFVTVPILCLVLLQLVSGLTVSVVQSFQEANGFQEDLKMDDAIFIAVSEPAAKNKSVFETRYKKSYAYIDTDRVVKDFDIGKIDYVVGYTAGILIIFLMLGATLTFIRQCVDLLLLYLVSPFFSATIALDGGSRFKKWREMFIAKFFMGFGSIFEINLFLMLIPFYTGNRILFSEDPSLNNCIKLFFIIGGAFAVFKGNSLILQVLSPAMADSANESMGKMAAWTARGGSWAAGHIPGLGK